MATAVVAAVFLGGMQEARSHSLPLPQRIHREQAQVSAFAPQFEVYAGQHHTIFREHQKASAGKPFVDLGQMETLGVDEEALHGESAID
jgi:hypothetical protein